MAGLPGVLLVLAPLAGLSTGLIPGLLLPPGIGAPGKQPGGLMGGHGSPLLGGLFGTKPPNGGGLGSILPTVNLQAGPGGIGGSTHVPGLFDAMMGIKPAGAGSGVPEHPLLGLLRGGSPSPGLGARNPSTGPQAPVGAPEATSSSSGAGSAGGGSTGDSSEEEDSNKKKRKPNKNTSSSGITRSPEKTPKQRFSGSTASGKNGDSSEENERKEASDNHGDAGSSGKKKGRKESPSQRRESGSRGSRKDGDSSEEKGSNKQNSSSDDSRNPEKQSKKRGSRGGSVGSQGKAGSSEETEAKKKRNSNEEDADSSESKRRGKKKCKGRRRGRRNGGGKSREKRSVVDEFGLMGFKGSHHVADNVPDHVKVVYCGRNEVPNPGGIEDHFCHPDSTWETLLRMRPDCICQQGYLRNSWGECISPAECDHCSDKHHLNMDYHLCESPCPIVCNQPIDENCANMCFKECACRPGYIRAYPNGPCVSIKQCLPGCRGRNQIFSLCSSLCPPTCRKPVPKRCPKICAGEGCVCKPGYVVKRWEPLECVRPEDCPGRRRKCPGPNQRYTRCIRRCVPSCFKRRHRYCGHECLGRGCVCKRGYVALQRRPLVCVRPDQCPKRHKKCPARNQVYMYCKSKCPRTCDNPNPRRCGWACDGEGCACKPGYVVKQEDPLICVRRYQCSSEFEGLEMLKGAKGGMGGAKGGIGGTKGGMGAEEAKGGLGAKGGIGGTKGGMGAEEAKGVLGAKGGIGEKGVIGAEEAKKVMGADEAEGAKEVEGTKRRRRKKGSSKRRKPSWEFSPQ